MSGTCFNMKLVKTMGLMAPAPDHPPKSRKSAAGVTWFAFFTCHSHLHNETGQTFTRINLSCSSGGTAGGGAPFAFGFVADFAAAELRLRRLARGAKDFQMTSPGTC